MAKDSKAKPSTEKADIPEAKTSGARSRAPKAPTTVAPTSAAAGEPLEQEDSTVGAHGPGATHAHPAVEVRGSEKKPTPAEERAATGLNLPVTADEFLPETGTVETPNTHDTPDAKSFGIHDPGSTL